MLKTFLTISVLASAALGSSLFPSYAQAQANPFASSYSCGPNFETYVVHALDSREGTGIRCVKRSNGSSSSSKVPIFAWYGEGSWYGSSCRYRHLGQAYYEKTGSTVIKGYASDFYGNGECADANYPGNLSITLVDADHIRVTGAGWNEEWTRVSTVDYVPLSAPTTCGSWFDEYRAVSTDDVTKTSSAKDAKPSHSGLRCVMKAGPRNTTWYGTGKWNDKSYSHVATGSSKGYGASDFCGANEGYCASFAYGTIKRIISTKTKLPTISGWNETWLKIK